MCSWFRLVLSVLVLGLGGPVASTAAGQNLARFTSRHYEVFTDVPPAEARPIAGHMDMVFAEYVNRFRDFPAKNSQPVKLYLLGTRSAYLDMLKRKGINGANTSGMFFASPQEAGLATYIEGQGSVAMFHVLQHEGFHQFAHLRLGPNLPQWANEGLAEYFGQSVLVKGKLRMGVAPEARIQGLNMAIRSRALWPFESLLTMTNEQWNKNVSAGNARAGLMYDQSWAMTHFLIHGDKGRYTAAFAKYIKLTSDGKTGVQAFTEAFGPEATPEQFQKAWEHFVQNDWEPDAVSTALERLEFLADGAALLMEQGVRVASLGELKKELQARQYRRTVTREGVRTEQHSDDHTLFDPPPKDDPRKPTSIEVRPGQRKGEPPSFRVTGLTVEILLTWELKPGKEPRAKVAFQ